MRIGANLGPCDDWQTIIQGAQEAERYGFDAVGFLDHYHVPKMEWSWMCGWSLYGALAMQTQRIQLVPMVIDHTNYVPGVLCKESTSLSLLSKGRFELAIGAGDLLEEELAWGLPVYPAQERVERLRETITVLREVWQGKPVDHNGNYIQLKGAASLPAPTQAIRVVVGAGSSRRLISSAVEYADEVNVYANDEIIQFAQAEIERAGREVALSAFVWDWPEDIRQRLLRWEQWGIARTFLTFWPPYDTLEPWSDMDKIRAGEPR